MKLAELHPEDIKAELRKQFRTIRRFEEENGLSRGSVHEVLRRRRWAKVERAIEKAIFGPEALSDKADSKAKPSAHRLCAEAK